MLPSRKNEWIINVNEIEGGMWYDADACHGDHLLLKLNCYFVVRNSHPLLDFHG